MQLNLKAYLAQKDMTMKEFAEKIGCTQQYISALAHGRRLASKRFAKDVFHETGGVIKLATSEDNVRVL